MKNKELTPLEALNLIYDKYVTDDEFLEDDKLFSIIEKALKEVSGEDKAFLRHVKTGKLHPLTTKYYQSLLEKQRVLEIIKTKRIDLEYLKCCKNYEQYKTICSYWNEITQEQFDLLKEVLSL